AEYGRGPRRPTNGSTLPHSKHSPPATRSCRATICTTPTACGSVGWPAALTAGVDVRTMDAGQLALADESVDLVYSYNVFEHLPDPAATVAEVARVLRPGGRFVLTFGPLGWSPHGAHMYKAVGVPH